MLKSGERARLFPILADNSKEGRTLSIFMACLENVPEFGRSLLGSLNLRLGKRTTIESYTEVVPKVALGIQKHRPDGLLSVDTSRSLWSAFVEAKVGAAELTNEQVEAYLELAKLNGIDAVITLSNQFASLPTHHPLVVKSALTKKVDLFHWSWGYVITRAHLLSNNGEVTDREQLVLLKELQRFLLHPSSGVKEFEQMPPAWSELCASVLAGGSVMANPAVAREAVAGWHQAVDHLTSLLSRQIDANVRIDLTRQQADDPSLRMKEGVAHLAKEGYLQATLLAPDVAAPIHICADLRKRSLIVQMRLKAPTDRKSTKAKVAWLVRQLAKIDPHDVYVRLLWPGRADPTQHRLAELLVSTDIASVGREGFNLLSMEVVLVKDLGGRFAQRRNFVADLLQAVPEFYDKAAENITAWQARPPKLPEAKSQPSSVSAESLREDLEVEAIERQA
jgi:hypothetical protein